MCLKCHTHLEFLRMTELIKSIQCANSPVWRLGPFEDKQPAQFFFTDMVTQCNDTIVLFVGAIRPY